MSTNLFWRNFIGNECYIRQSLETYRDFRDSAPIDEFSLQLQNYYPDFGFEMRPEEKGVDGRYRLTLSCGGRRDYFLMLKHLVATAPKHPYWTVKAFLKPKGPLEVMLDEVFDFNACIIIPNTLTFAVHNWCEERGLFDLRLVLPLPLKAIEVEKLEDYVYIMFQDIWGEKFVGG